MYWKGIKWRKPITDVVTQLATDLDKSPTGEAIIQNLLTAQVLLQRENAELRLQFHEMLDRVTALIKLVADHQAALDLLNRPPQGEIIH